MGFRFRKSIRLGKNARINLSRRGVGASFGVRGARYTVGPGARPGRGRRWTFSLPGTGLAYQTRATGGQRPRRASCCLSALVLLPAALMRAAAARTGAG